MRAGRVCERGKSGELRQEPAAPGGGAPER